MKVTIESSKFLKPSYTGGNCSTTSHVPLSVFDKVTFDYHQAVVYAFPPPAPPNSAIERGLAAVLAKYRALAGRLGEDADGNPAVVLNDAGLLFVEASTDASRDALPARPAPELLGLHPDTHGAAALAQVQLTRFACGALAVGFTACHLVADGHATSNFLVAWGRATRGLDLGALPIHCRGALLAPRGGPPPQLAFEHHGVEYVPRSSVGAKNEYSLKDGDKIAMQKVHFAKDFIGALRAKASEGAARPYSRFEAILAHLWRAVTRARGLGAGESTKIRVSVGGRARMSPRVPDAYFGNLVLWAWPHATAGELVGRPVWHAAELIRAAVRRVADDGYFRSFMAFASSGAVEAERLAPAQVLARGTRWPDMEVDSWLTFPFYDLDFGGGAADYFMPAYYSTEGTLYLLPSYAGEGSIDAFVPMFASNLEAFEDCCYSLD